MSKAALFDHFPSTPSQPIAANDNESAMPSCQQPTYFNPNLIVSPEASNGLTGIIQAEAFPTGMVRKDAYEKLIQVMAIAIANLSRIAANDNAGLVVSFNKAVIDKRSRYKPPVIIYRRLRLVFDQLEAAGIISIQKGGTRRIEVAGSIPPRWTRERTVVRLLKHHEELARLNATGAVQHSEQTERIELRVEKEPSEYDDTLETVQLRCDVHSINHHLMAHPVVYEGLEHVDRSSNQLVRIFNNTFELGGRLYGHFGQNLIKSERHFLTIDGEQLADLDYQAMHHALLYVENGLTPPGTCDPFGLPGMGKLRPLIKTASYAILNALRPLNNYPEDMREISQGLSWRQLEALVFTHVPLIKANAYRGIGLRLQKLESDILIRSLNELVKLNIGFLPMHDGIMVPRSMASITEKIMQDAYHTATGHTIIVKNKPIQAPTTQLECYKEQSH